MTIDAVNAALTDACAYVANSEVSKWGYRQVEWLINGSIDVASILADKALELQQLALPHIEKVSSLLTRNQWSIILAGVGLAITTVVFIKVMNCSQHQNSSVNHSASLKHS